jgi:polysaccharide pyruvyl transferase WcaK-like protein
MCDSDKRFLLPLLDRIEAAAVRGVPTVLLGQGVGPLRDAELRARISEVLPLAEWVFVRESLLAPALLESLGIAGRAIVTTGDDAVELAYAARPWTPGNGIGLSLRLASYTKVTGEHLGLIGNAVRLVAEKYNAPVVAVPIDANDADLCHIRRSLGGVRHARFPSRRFETPLEVIRRAGSCRVMVSGTFHAAVFALSQGIPVVALSNSDEYLIKISGLAAAFGFRGCQIVELGNPGVGEKLAQALESLWRAADDLRPELLIEAQRQIEMAKAAYERVRGLARKPTNRGTEKSTVSRGVSD